jgi:hypothetical protein
MFWRRSSYGVDWQGDCELNIWTDKKELLWPVLVLCRDERRKPWKFAFEWRFGRRICQIQANIGKESTRLSVKCCLHWDIFCDHCACLVVPVAPSPVRSVTALCRHYSLQEKHCSWLPLIRFFFCLQVFSYTSIEIILKNLIFLCN